MTVCSNTINVYTLEDYSIEPKVNSHFNDKIVECIPISVLLVTAAAARGAPRRDRAAPREIETTI